MGMSGISKSSVSKLCKDIDERVNAFLKRPLSGEWPYLWLDATYLKVRAGGRIVSVAAIIAVAVTTEGKREIVGLPIGPSEAEPFWTTFLRDLAKRGLKGVKLVISDAHEELKKPSPALWAPPGSAAASRPLHEECAGARAQGPDNHGGGCDSADLPPAKSRRGGAVLACPGNLGAGRNHGLGGRRKSHHHQGAPAGVGQISKPSRERISQAPALNPPSS